MGEGGKMEDIMEEGESEHQLVHSAMHDQTGPQNACRIRFQVNLTIKQFNCINFVRCSLSDVFY